MRRTWSFGSLVVTVTIVAAPPAAAVAQERGWEPLVTESQPLLRRLRAEMPRLGFECITPEGTTSPIITFTMADGTGVAERLSRAGVDARVAPTWVRFSPSVYNDMADVERALEALS